MTIRVDPSCQIGEDRVTLIRGDSLDQELPLGNAQREARSLLKEPRQARNDLLGRRREGGMVAGVHRESVHCDR
ncbi:MAG: hypothetical protein EXR92_07515 [Gemmatimonadetes bacterium]|nr:hypothetical protein [Gemmatimonadota bacterium]